MLLQHPARCSDATQVLRRLASVFALTSLVSLHSFAQGKQAPAGTVSTGVPVVMLSDIHFEPFQDPAKVAQLRDASIDQWEAILNAPASATRDVDLTALQKACPVRGTDTGWPLLAASLQQAAATQPRPLFVTVSGDLLSHAFDCRFRALTPKATTEDAGAFASRTVAFVTAELRHAFPNSPVYLALGNNDSGCGDYRETPDSAFLEQAGQAFAAATLGGAGTRSDHQANAQAVLRSFSAEGDYNIALPPPMQNAHLVVLQDLFESVHIASCADKPEPAAADAQLAWLKEQLDQARAGHQRVWVMAHLPPGVDIYSTLTGKHDLCGGKPPIMFLGSEKLADVLVAYPDVIALALFAHTHADEVRWLHGPASSAGPASGIAVKLVSSISPVNGNTPTFTVAQVDPGTAGINDYTVYQVGQDATGSASTREYSFRETYKLPAFSAASLATLTQAFLDDKDGSSAASQAYQHLYFPGDTGLHAAAMQLFWHTYACSLREDAPAAFQACVCPAAATTGSK